MKLLSEQNINVIDVYENYPTNSANNNICMDNLANLHNNYEHLAELEQRIIAMRQKYSDAIKAERQIIAQFYQNKFDQLTLRNKSIFTISHFNSQNEFHGPFKLHISSAYPGFSFIVENDFYTIESSDATIPNYYLLSSYYDYCDSQSLEPVFADFQSAINSGKTSYVFPNTKIFANVPILRNIFKLRD